MKLIAAAVLLPSLAGAVPSESGVFSISALGASVAAMRAAAPAKTRAIPITFLPGADKSREKELKAAWASLSRKFPGIVIPSIVAGIEVAPDSKDPKAFPDCAYDDVRLMIRLQAACLRLEETRVMPGLYREAGSGIEAMLFHEALHGWHVLHDEKTGGSITEDYDKLTGERVREYARRGYEWFTSQNWTGRDAEVYPAKDAKEWELVQELKIPYRHVGDAHAGERQAELFAYAGEFAFYSAEPSRWLTPTELLYWGALSAVLRLPPGGL